MADPVAAAAVTAGGQLAGGGLAAIGEGQANAREGRLYGQQASTLHEFVQQHVLPTDTTGLEAQANKLITRGQQSLNATLGAQGLVSSGAHQNRALDLRSEVISGLAQAINQDQLGRAQTGAQVYSQDAFGFFDPKTGTPTNQGK